VPAEDPQTQALKDRAQQDEAAAGMDRAKIDSASLMARYGTRLTLAAAGGSSPMVSGASPTMSSDQVGGGTGNTLSTLLTQIMNGRAA